MGLGLGLGLRLGLGSGLGLGLRSWLGLVELLHALDGRERGGQIHLVCEEDDRHLQP